MKLNINETASALSAIATIVFLAYFIKPEWFAFEKHETPSVVAQNQIIATSTPEIKESIKVVERVVEKPVYQTIVKEVIKEVPATTTPLKVEIVNPEVKATTTNLNLEPIIVKEERKDPFEIINWSTEIQELTVNKESIPYVWDPKTQIRDSTAFKNYTLHKFTVRIQANQRQGTTATLTKCEYETKHITGYKKVETVEQNSRGDYVMYMTTNDAEPNYNKYRCYYSYLDEGGTRTGWGAWQTFNY